MFTAEEVRLIREAAKAMPLGGARDPGRAQLSSLVDHAAAGDVEQLVMEIDVREQAIKISRGAAAALRQLVQGIELTPEERVRLQPTDPEGTFAKRHKRAMALRYVNKLRQLGEQSQRPLRR